MPTIQISAILGVDSDTEVRLVGELEVLGAWRAEKGLPLTRQSQYKSSMVPSYFSATVHVPDVEFFLCKLVKVDNGKVEWEGNLSKDNRRVYLRQADVPASALTLPYDAGAVVKGVYSPPPLRFHVNELETEHAITSRYYSWVRGTFGMDFDKVLPRVLVGTCPLSEEHITMLRSEQGVTTVLNFQTHEDLMKNWIRVQTDSLDVRSEAAYYETYDRHGIKVVWYPTTDISTVARGRTMAQAALILHALLSRSESEVVYVHCNAGVGRSAGCVLSYLRIYHKLGSTECHHWMSSRRPVAYVDVEAMEFAANDYVRKFV
ncbi:MAG: uncharacterized protein KVP18_000997 [Porospora cf. gigantea A]|uniref:uncharacterized protein n=1 Tax=Porospora cf. gigantea A TaxID=2853593 RepID=UPI0035598F73|nr:MAG: hypothetical protein KVP18_000997 [Porospora cf. gigantea A]